MPKKLKSNQLEIANDLKRAQLKIRKEFEYLETIDNFGAEFVLAQAKEICNYFHRLILISFPAWESFLYQSIARDKEGFMNAFYIRQHECGMYEPDLDRIDKLRI